MRMAHIQAVLLRTRLAGGGHGSSLSVRLTPTTPRPLRAHIFECAKSSLSARFVSS